MLCNSRYPDEEWTGGVPNNVISPDAATLVYLLSRRHWRGPGEFARWAMR